MKVLLLKQLGLGLFDALFRRLVHGGLATSGSAAGLLKGSKVPRMPATPGQDRAAALDAAAPLAAGYFAYG
ncbi:hypothetical protein E4631_21420 [Hymenobacter sp. UV11]|uniref:hypothetical protein n=1 Tax=Hymenobacter sp. UV11 TaxID=1849735 RepID=UPI00105F25CF|nr:hypothetical protein [Hymenobacter sp. UV11]TFZ63846.1 hypothetical protein E4631_21420 [Hymenobacter sp. UV11]